MLLDRIEAFMRERRMTPTRFGREAVNDAKFVLQLRAGREPRARTLRRVEEYLEQTEGAQPSVAEGPVSNSTKAAQRTAA